MNNGIFSRVSMRDFIFPIIRNIFFTVFFLIKSIQYPVKNLCSTVLRAQDPKSGIHGKGSLDFYRLMTESERVWYQATSACRGHSWEYFMWFGFRAKYSLRKNIQQIIWQDWVLRGVNKALHIGWIVGELQTFFVRPTLEYWVKTKFVWSFDETGN